MQVPEAGEQVDSPAPCVPSHHPPPTCLSRRIFLLALASRYRRSPSWGEKQGQTMVQMGQLAPHPCYCLTTAPPPKGPRRSCSPEVFWSHWGSQSQSNLTGTRQVTEPQLPLKLSE